MTTETGTKLFDIRDQRGILKAEQYKEALNAKYSNVQVTQIGINAVSIRGYNQ